MFVAPLAAWRAIVAAPVAALLLSACAGGTAPTTTPSQVQIQAQAQTRAINRSLAAAASRQAAFVADYANESYRLGAGDVLDIAVFQVDELNRKVRVNGGGNIILPLLGEIRVAGKTVAEVEQTLAERLGEQYLRNPQVSVFVEEYRSQRITVMGAVQEPGVFNVWRPRTVIEMLSTAGGLNEDAGTKLYVQLTRADPASGRQSQQSLIIDLKQILESGDPQYNVVLHGGDSIHVPKAGVVFVEGAVRKPGAYPMKGETNVLKAIAMAGGTLFEASEGAIQVFRQGPAEGQVVNVDLAAVRDRRTPDLVLRDGDIVVVRSNALKKGFAGFWRGFTGIFTVGTRI